MTPVEPQGTFTQQSDQFNDAVEGSVQPSKSQEDSNPLSASQIEHDLRLDDYSDSDYQDDKDDDYQDGLLNDVAEQEERDDLQQVGRVEDADWELARGGEYKGEAPFWVIPEGFIVPRRFKSSGSMP